MLRELTVTYTIFNFKNVLNKCLILTRQVPSRYTKHSWDVTGLYLTHAWQLSNTYLARTR